MERLEWNVFVEHNDKIEVHNIFEHVRFMNDLIKINKEFKTIEGFEKQVELSLMYFYWGKSEWEIVITTFPPYINNEELESLNKERDECINNFGRFIRTYVNLETAEQVDVYRQVKMNWKPFIHYLWNNRKLIKRCK